MTYIPHFSRYPANNTHHDTYKTDERNTRKAEIEYLISEGHTRKEIAEALGISSATLANRMNRYGIRFKK